MSFEVVVTVRRADLPRPQQGGIAGRPFRVEHMLPPEQEPLP